MRCKNIYLEQYTNHLFRKEDTTIYGKIPREIIYNKELGAKRALFYLFMYFQFPLSGFALFNKASTLSSCGFNPNVVNGTVKSDLEQLIHDLEDKGYIKLLEDKRYYQKYAALAPLYEQNPFALIHYSEFSKIIQNRANHATALLLLSFLRLNTYRRKNARDKRPEIYFCHLCDIADRIGISVRCVASSLKSLTDANVLYGEELPRYQDEHHNWHSGVYIFVDMVKYNQDEPDNQYDWQEELNNGIKWVKKQQMEYLRG